MPATDQIWRNIKTMHVVFCATSLLMLFSFLWMFAQDHNRPWKPYQTEFRQIEETTTQWEIDALKTEQYLFAHDELQIELLVAKGVAPEKAIVESFQAEVNAGKEEAYDFSNWDEELASMQKGAAGLEATKAKLEAEDLPEEEKASLKRQYEQELIAFAQQKDNFLARMDSFVKTAKFHEDNALVSRKFRAADLDAVRSDFDLGVRDNKPEEELKQLQQAVNAVQADVNGKTETYQKATTHRKTLQGLLAQLTAAADEVNKEITASHSDLKQLVDTRRAKEANWLYDGFPGLGKKWNELPILDAFNSSIKIDQIWLPELKQNFSHKMVARFDRCRTCHLAIDKTAKGSPTEPMFSDSQPIFLSLKLPEEAPKADDRGVVPTLEETYGIALADRGLRKFDDVTVSIVRSKSLAATAKQVADADEDEAKVLFEEEILNNVKDDKQLGSILGSSGLMPGDIIEEINGNKIIGNQQVERLLMKSASFGEDQFATIKIRRGMAHPFSSHPRLDLFLGSLSPHKIEEVGCTVCHDGQGSATDFKWVSHTPDNLKDQAEWKKQYGWFNNHHWTMPMHSKRFVESSCIKCHHEVVELEPSERFPEAPAPKVVKGYNTIRKYGCYGCHEIKGYDGPDKRIGPDLRLEPNYYATAQQLLATPGSEALTAEQKEWAQLLIAHPEQDGVRNKLAESIKTDARAKDPALNSDIHGMANQLKDQETPGQFRKAGPSLRYVANKVEADFLYDWVREPKNFRDSTRMPQFFGLWSHLDHGSYAEEVAKRMEPVEILGIVKYLEEKSQKFDYLTPPEGITPSSPAEMISRGKDLFETRGCLACHSHDDFPAASADQGPELSNIGDKFKGENGRKWLYSWIKEPERYHVRTKMPNLYLDPIEEADGTVTDPAADIAEYLLTSSNGYKPDHPQLTADQENLDALVLEHLEGAFFSDAAATYMKTGIPEEKKAELKGAEVELLGSMTEEKKLQYVGRKALGKYGCYACHDIPGFEDAKPIGAALNDWGRKDTSKLAFEHINEYLHHQHGGAHGHGAHEAHEEDGHHEGEEAGHHEEEGGEHAEHADNHESKLKHRGQTPFPSDFYLHQIEGHSRIGFIEQKLREPRSYDYKKAGNKKYNDRLRMPQFPFKDDAERESVITFVLGLIAEPPADQYVFNPEPRKKAIVEGRKVLDKYNCAGCHILEMEKWDLAFEPGFFGAQPVAPTYPFVETHFSAQEIADSQKQDKAGLVHGSIVGMPAVDDRTGQPVVVDDFGDPVEPDFDYKPEWLQYRMQLWEPALLDGNAYPVGLLRQDIPVSVIEKRHPALGGYLAKLLLPSVLKAEQKNNPNAKGSEAWAWLPPPLVGQGDKAQASWMHDFLLDPYPIRPAVVLRMPKFNMTSEEATKLANYFAAVDNADYPYEFDQRKRSGHLAQSQIDYSKLADAVGKPETDRLADAMGVVIHKDYCVKCHIVGDFVPMGGGKALAPDLADIYRRLRPDYVRKWIANPASILPYTGMPVNIPYKPGEENQGGINQALYHGTSIDQVDGLVDLLMNYDEFAKAQALVTPMVEASAKSTAPPEGAEPDTAGAPAE